MRERSTDFEDLRRLVRDLMSLTALPALWAGRRPPEIAASLVDVISKLVPSELVYVRIGETRDGTRVACDHHAGPEATEERLARLRAGEAPIPGAPPGLLPGSDLRAVSVGLGIQSGVDSLLVASRRETFPTQEELLLLQVATNQAAVTLESARLAALEARQAQLLARVGIALSRTSSVSEMLSRCTDAIVEVLQVALARVFVVPPGEDALSLQASSGLPIQDTGLVTRVRVGECAIGRIAEGRTPYLSNDLRTVPGLADPDWIEREGLVAFAGYPLIVDGNLVGVMTLFARHELPESLMEILGSLADLIAVGVQRKHVDATAEIHRENLDVTNRALASYLTTSEWRKPSGEVLRRALECTNSQYGFFGVIIEGPVLRVLAWDGFNWDAVTNRAFYDSVRQRSEAVGYLDFPKLDNLFGWPIRHGEPLLTNDPARDPRSTGLPPGHPPLRSFLGVPIKDNQVIGLIGVANREGGYSAAHVKALESLGQLAAVLCQSFLSRKKQALLESQLQQSQKMEAIGRLAGGVAHDFNNLMTVVIGNIHQLIAELDLDTELMQSAEDIQHAAERAALLTQQLLAFSRRQVLQPKILDLQAVVLRLQSMLQRLIGERITLKVSQSGPVGAVNADESRIEQVIVNLVVNAKDAMPEGGTIVIETGEAEVEAPQGDSRPAPGGRCVTITVTDTGTGISERDRSRIFEPFFTTKAFGKGSGLGLSMVDGIVNQSGGFITLKSELGKGSSFCVHLPRVRATLPDVLRKPRQEPPRGTETILLVEDEVRVLKLAQSILSRLGYTVLEAVTPERATRLCRETVGPIHLLLTDVVMPQLNGPQLFERLRPQRPEMKVLYMSGYADGVSNDQGEIDPTVKFLPKPFSPLGLASRVREILDERADDEG